MLYELFTFGQLPYTTFTNKKVFAKVTKYVVHSYMCTFLNLNFPKNRGYRLPQPQNCPDQIYELMQACWKAEATERPSWFQIYKQLNRFDKQAKKKAKPEKSVEAAEEFEKAAEMYDIYASLPSGFGSPRTASSLSETG